MDDSRSYADNIRATTYSRSYCTLDDYAYAVEASWGLWSLFCLFGPSWIWNFKHERWDVSHNVDTCSEEYMSDIDLVLKTLSTVRTKKQNEKVY